MKNKLRLPLFFMVMTIIVISAFQFYWLRKNFGEEKRLFGARSNIIFRETIMRLQAGKLHLDSNIRIRQDKEAIIDIATVLQDNIDTGDISEHHQKVTKAMMIRVSDTGMPHHDSNIQFQIQRGKPGQPVFNFLLGVDSLRDSISVKEVSTRYAAALAAQHMVVPFTVSVAETTGGPVPMRTLSDDNKVAVGFIHPRIFQVDFEDNNWYITKHLWQPIVVSILLVGITIASFLLLYRNLVRQQKLTQFKNDFISNITHELKTPIATVSVAIEALKNFNALQDPQRTREYLDISGNEMQRLSLLVDKVLKLSLYEKKEISLNKEPFNLVVLANEVVASMKLQFDKQSADVTVTTTGNNFIIEADRLHLTSVLYNLLDNALKYSNGKPVIQVHITDHTQFMELAVTDNGIGIATEYRYKIFEQFFRVPGGDRHNTKGYGLGLSYVRHIVQRHMGFIEVTSRPGEGSIFLVKLPFKEAPVIDYGQGRQIRKMTFKAGKS